MSKDLIPTFEVGERVICHIKYIEFACPLCGSTQTNGNPLPMGYSGKVTILGRTTLAICPMCNGRVEMPEGWYTIEEPHITLPYTLLQKLPAQE